MKQSLTCTVLATALLVGCVPPPVGEQPTVTETVWTTPQPPPRQSPAEQSVAQGVEQAVAQVIARHGGQAEVAVVEGVHVHSAGQVDDAPAWSTIKVPVAVAALKRHPDLLATVRAAITVSDNQAAEQLWHSLGTPAQAGRATEDVLSEAGAAGTVQTGFPRPEFSSYGQTRWHPADQARFAAGLPCLVGAEPVLEAMGQITSGQDYGLGTIPGARYKGGWGPDPDGTYVVRQFGVLPASEGQGVSSVALVVRPASGTYAAGQAMLTDLVAHLPALPATTCT